MWYTDEQMSKWGFGKEWGGDYGNCYCAFSKDFSIRINYYPNEDNWEVIEKSNSPYYPDDLIEVLHGLEDEEIEMMLKEYDIQTN